MTNADRLRKLKKKYKLTNARIAEITGYSVGAVDLWFAAPGSKRYRGDVSDRVYNSVKLAIEHVNR